MDTSELCKAIEQAVHAAKARASWYSSEGEETIRIHDEVIVDAKAVGWIYGSVPSTYLDDDESKDHLTQCRRRGFHRWVNSGFMTIKMVCGDCDCEKPKKMLEGNLKIGKIYYRSDNGAEVKILAEKQGSSTSLLSEYEYYMLGSDGNNYLRSGEVTYRDDHKWGERAGNWFLHEGEKA